MNRDTLKDGLENGFGSSEYAREELRAEISAMMTGERVGVGHDPQRGAAYVENWVKVLEKDPHEIHRAARDAQKMSDYLMKRAIDREVANPSKEKTRAEVDPGILPCSRPQDQPNAEATDATTRSSATARRGAEPLRSRRVRSARPNQRPANPARSSPQARSSKGA